MTAKPLLDAALDYAGRGLAVIPLHTPTRRGCSCGKADCDQVGKHPRWHKDLLPHGVKDATTDEATIRAWWEMWPDANVGIDTSGLFVLDLDTPEALTDAIAEGIPPAPWVMTAKGMHIYFRDFPTARNSVKFAPGMDTRARGGYVVAPPSLHASGARYTWEVSLDEATLPTPPAWLIEAVSTKLTPTGPSSPLPALSGVQDPGALTLLQQCVDEVSRAREGARNDTLNRAAYTVGGLIGARRLSPGGTYDALQAAARSVGLHEREIQRTLNSGLTAGAMHPLESRPMPSSNGHRPTAPDEAPALPHAPRRRTDLGNAERLVDLHGQNLRYCHDWKQWLAWDGRRWKVDATAAVERCAKDTVRRIYTEAAAVTGEDDAAQDLRKSLYRWATASESAGHIHAMIDLAASEPGIPVTPDDLDPDPWLLNCLNGVLDLRTGELHPHDRALLITKLCPVEYRADATAPTWDAFLSRIMGNNQALIGFLQRAIGYTLTGDVSERVLFLLHGVGANGKSTLLEAIRDTMGDYSQRTPTETLMLQRGNTGPRDDIARLKGARFVSASESDDGRRLAESLVKDLTGGDTITARFLYARLFEYRPEFKIWLATNHRPEIRGTDAAIWDRLRLIPFSVRIPEGERDRHLATKLRAELPGILAWVVRGCREWQAHGLQAPREVLAATDQYRADMDDLAGWLAECCTVGADVSAPATAAVESFNAYTGQRMTPKRFARALTERGFTSSRTKLGVRWHGFGLLTTTEPTHPAPLV